MRVRRLATSGVEIEPEHFGRVDLGNHVRGAAVAGQGLGDPAAHRALVGIEKLTGPRRQLIIVALAGGKRILDLTRLRNTLEALASRGGCWLLTTQLLFALDFAIGIARGTYVMVASLY